MLMANTYQKTLPPYRIVRDRRNPKTLPERMFLSDIVQSLSHFLLL
jgi:hypothetical protein